MVLMLTLVKIYNEKEQAEQGKLQDANLEEKKSTKKQNEAKSCVQEDKLIKRENKGSVDLTARCHPAKFSTVERN